MSTFLLFTERISESWVSVFKSFEDKSEEKLVKENLDVAMIYKILALSYGLQKIYDKAETNIQKALRITKELRGEKDSIYVSCLNDLAIIYHFQEKYKDAKFQYLQVLGVYTELLIKLCSSIHTTPEDLVSISKPIVHILNNLATLCKSQGCSKEDKICFQEYLNLLKKSLGEKHPYTQEVLIEYQNLLNKKDE